MSAKGQFAHSALWMVLGTSFNQLAALTVFVILSRILSPLEFGLVAFASIFVELARPLVVAGVSDTLVRQPEWTPSAASTAFWLNGAFAIFVAIVAIAVGLPLITLGGYKGVEIAYVVLVTTLIMDSFSSVPEAKLRREFQYKILTQMSGITALVSGIAGIALAFAGFGIWALVTQRVVTSLLGVTLIWIKSRWLFAFEFNREECKRLGRFAIGLISGQLLANINGQVASLVIGYGLGPAALALYRAGDRILSIFTQLVIAPIQRVALTAFARAQERGDVAGVYARLTGACALIACPVFLGAGAIARDLVTVLFGQKWAQSGDVMTMGSLVVGVSVVNYFFSSSLSAKGNTRGPVIYFATAITGNLLLGALALPFGLLTVVFSQSARGYLGLPVTLSILKREIGLKPMTILSNVMPPLFCSLAMAAILIGTQKLLLADWAPFARIVALAPLGALLYSVLMFIFGRTALRNNLNELLPLAPSFISKRFIR